MKWSQEAKVGVFSFIGILLFSVIIIQLSSAVLFGKSGFHVTAYFREAEGIEPGNPIHYAGVDVGMVDHISIENGEAVLVLRFYDDVKVPKDANFSIQTSSVIGRDVCKINTGKLKWVEDFVTRAEDFDIELLRDALSSQEAIFRFSGYQNYDYVLTQQNRQAITDVLNAYNLMCSVSPDVLRKALA